MKTRSLLVLLIACIFVGCTDWQAEYKKQLAKDFAPVKKKFEFANELFNSKSDSCNCVIVDDYDELSIEQKAMMGNASCYSYESEENDDVEEYIIIHSSPITSNLCDSDFFVHNSFKSYHSFLNSRISGKRDMNNHLDNFNSYIVEPFLKFKYLIVINDKILIKPKMERYYTFRTGYIYSEVDIYDLKTRQNIGSFDIKSRNGDYIEPEHLFSSYSDLLSDLYKNHKSGIMKQVKIII